MFRVLAICIVLFVASDAFAQSCLNGVCAVPSKAAKKTASTVQSSKTVASPTVKSQPVVFSSAVVVKERRGLLRGRLFKGRLFNGKCCGG